MTDLNYQSALFAEDCYKLVEDFFATLHHVTKNKNLKNGFALFFSKLPLYAFLLFFMYPIYSNQ